MESLNDIYNIYYKYPSQDRTKDIKGKIYFIPYDLKKGFRCGYSIFIPDGCKLDTTLLVHCCNTGGAGVTSGKLDGRKSAISLSEGNEAVKLSAMQLDFGIWLGSDLKIPVLIPLIPRVRGYYTQDLGSKVLKNDISGLIEDNNMRSDNKKISIEEIKQIKEQCEDLPTQLVNMIKNSKEFLSQLNIKIDDKVIIEGYSAGSKFANCFMALHPEIIKACICGGNTGLGILPIAQLNGQILNYPLGVADIPNFNEKAFKNVPQYYFIGDKDTNDPAAILDDKKDINGNFIPKYIENYTPEEVTLIYRLLGKNTQERFDNNQRMYKLLGVNSVFVKFNGDHSSIMRLRDNNGNFIVNKSVESFINKILNM